MSSHLKKERGYTLIELLIAMFLSIVSLVAIFKAYDSQSRAYVLQEQIVALQQNLRAAKFHMERDFRMIGFDPNRPPDRAGALRAEADMLHYSLTDDDNNIATVTYYLYPRTGTTGTKHLYRTFNQPVSEGESTDDYLARIVSPGDMLAENIEALNFVYLANPQMGRVILNDPDSLGNVPNTAINRIRLIEVCAVAKTNREIRGHVDDDVFRNRENEIILTAQNDGFMRRFLETTVKCRNLWGRGE